MLPKSDPNSRKFVIIPFIEYKLLPSTPTYIPCKGRRLTLNSFDSCHSLSIICRNIKSIVWEPLKAVLSTYFWEINSPPISKQGTEQLTDEFEKRIKNMTFNLYYKGWFIVNSQPVHPLVILKSSPHPSCHAKAAQEASTRVIMNEHPLSITTK